jgi:hypothetical protein
MEKEAMHVRNQADHGSFMPIHSAIAFLVFGAITCGFASAQERQPGGPTPSPKGAELYFVGLKDRATVGTKVVIRFGLRGMGIAPAGEDRENTGHHHLLIDAELPPPGQPIPNDDTHLHFDAGETEAEITLAPGTHTLQLVLGDKDHVAHDPPVTSARIQVVASEASAAPARATPTSAAPAATSAPTAKRPALPSPDALRRRIPEQFERYMPDPRDFRR